MIGAATGNGGGPCKEITTQTGFPDVTEGIDPASNLRDIPPSCLADVINLLQRDAYFNIKLKIAIKFNIVKIIQYRGWIICVS